jgi:hypothetical protein
MSVPHPHPPASVIGVTPQEANVIFQAVMGHAPMLANQSEKWPDPIEAASCLTKGLAHSLKLVDIAPNSYHAEVDQIFSGGINLDSPLVKHLGITNDQIREWRGQGVLVDQLQQRLFALTLNI